ncbi:hypothetical protein QBC44DRAFT_59236 [Cladorrhinum sp. PSN332]|nr:hypothetical protein QBC44DRAFT_59236 [Cladorrhinum sp. PSN332]
MSSEEDHTVTIREALNPLASPSASQKQITSAVETITELFNALTARPTTAADPYSEDLIHDLLSDYLGSLFATIFNLIKKTPQENQTHIIGFLQQLQRQSLTRSDLKFDDKEIWADLPTFGWAARDNFNFDVHDKANSKSEERQEWENIAYFLATLTALEPVKPVFDFSLFGLWTLREAFESNEGDTEEGVKLAAIWVHVAGKRLKGLSKKGKDFDSRLGVAGPKYEEKHADWIGFSEERWGIWKEGFQRAEEWVESEDAQGLVKKALELF